jgi:CIC family chloride channel protein
MNLPDLSYIKRIPERTRTIATIVVLSLAAACMAVAFLFLTNHLFSWTFGWYATRSKVFFLISSFATIMTTSLIVGVLLNKLSPDAAGSGIPQLKAAYWTELGYVPIKPVLVKFIAGVLSLGGGTSLGREGPTVFMGGGLSSWLSGYLGFPKRERRSTSLVGASAGLAATFNTPLAAITFVLEEIVGDINSRAIGKVLISAIVGAFTVYALIGRQPSFSVPTLEETSWVNFALAPLVALVASLLGIAFHRQSISWRRRIKKQCRIPMWATPMIGAFITWCIGAPIFLVTGKLGVFGLGYQDLSSVLNGDFVWWIAGVLVVGKLIATIASYSFGGCGGIFSPLLFIGGLTGFFIGSVCAQWIPLTRSDLIILSAVGMSTCLGTVVKAPLSAMLIVFEMTHQFALVPALLIGMAVSMTVSKLTGSENFYDAILVQDGHDIHKIKPPLDMTGWQQLPISTIYHKKPVAVTSVARPALQNIIDTYPYECYPYVKDGNLAGLITRKGIEDYLSHNTPVVPVAIVSCSLDATVKQVAELFIDSSQGMMAITDNSGTLLGVVTLHDILRAQAAAME